MRVSISNIVESQLPSFIQEEYPLFSEFLRRYYLSLVSDQEIQNLDKNIDFDVIFNLRDSAILADDVDLNSNEISADSTDGFPDKNGLIQIDNEIIFYERKNNNTFFDCKRGFSGITKIEKEIEFSQSSKERHFSGEPIINLNILLLQQFAFSTRKKIAAGFEDRQFFEKLNVSNFIKRIKDFYSSKGSDESFKILFAALYGEKVEIIRPQDYLIRPSDAQWRITKDLIVEAIEGNPFDLENSTIFQDETPNIFPAQGTIVSVQKVQQPEKNYYILSLDFDYSKDTDFSGTTRSEFSIHPRTKCTSSVPAGSPFIDVDSTVGFPDFDGVLKIFVGGEPIFVSYGRRILNQFVDCIGITEEILEGSEIITDDFIYGLNSKQEIITMRVNGSLGEIDILDDNFCYEQGEKISLKTFGENSRLLKANNWFFNVPVSYEVESIVLQESINNIYSAKLFDKHNFVIGDTFTLTSSTGQIFFGEIYFVLTDTSISIVGQGELDLKLKYTIKKNNSKVKVKTEKYKNLEIFNSNVHNTYVDYQNNVYVSSPSLPSYFGEGLEIKDFILEIPDRDYTGLQEITFNLNHPYFTGDAVVFKPSRFDIADSEILPNGIYYVYKVNSKTIKLSTNKENLYTNNFLTFTSGRTGLLEPIYFTDLNLDTLQIQPQNIFKSINSFDSSEGDITEPGKIGIFINGVEIVNYKSEDSVFYGGLDKIEISNSGSDYNVVKVPEITVTDENGSGAIVIAGVTGKLEKINIIDAGFDYIEPPSLVVSGGGGEGVRTKVSLEQFNYSLDFFAPDVNTITDTIVFSENHKFTNGEEVTYSSNGGNQVPGLINGSNYFVSSINNFTISLHYNRQNALDSVNPVNIIAVENGIHTITSNKIRQRLSKITLLDGGRNFKNKKVRALSINNALDEIYIPNHEFKNKEIIKYFPTDQVIVGLSTEQLYYVKVIDENTIKLAEISSSEPPTTFFDRENFVNLISVGSGKHYFNYPEISVSLEGKIGIANTTFEAQIQPVFSGEITSVFIDEKGSNYGSQEIINFQRKPEIEIKSGRDAIVTPVISDGKIVRVVVESPGLDYQQIPDLLISGTGSGAVLTPILSNGSLVEVKVIKEGIGYTPSTNIIIVSKGNGVKFISKIESRRINLVEKLKLIDGITLDDGYIYPNVDSLQYTHLYASRELRKSTYRFVGGQNRIDLIFNDVEVFNPATTVHSPLIGFAYDGNPIYGPYGFSPPTGGPIKKLKSGYSLKSNSKLIAEGRPSLNLYPKGFFVSDYEFINQGDLDEYNGRYCVTPEFPDGVYAYFCPISDVLSETGPFINYFEPVFPYVVGERFKNKEIKSDLNGIPEKILRNTTPYNLGSKKSQYNYILGVDSIGKDIYEIKKVNSSSISEINVDEPGNFYKSRDFIRLTDQTFAEIGFTSGVGINTILLEEKFIDTVQIFPFKNGFIGISTFPHDVVGRTEFIFNSSLEVNKKLTIENFTNNLIIAKNIEPVLSSNTIDFIQVIGNLNFPLKENDIFTADDEQIKILNVYSKFSTLKVLRNINSISGIETHTAGSTLVSQSRNLFFTDTFDNNYTSRVNREYYFDPKRTLGIGTIGITTVFPDFTGIGKTFVELNPATLFIENHNLQNYDSLFYSSKENAPIEISISGLGTTSLSQNQELFVTLFDHNVIGLSTQLAGVGSTNNLIFFENVGSGELHSFITRFDNVLSGSLSKNIVNVFTSDNHNLQSTEEVIVDVKSNLDFTLNLSYNDVNRRYCANKKEITSVDLIENTLFIENHGYTNGEKIIYTSTNLIGGLNNNQIYFVIFVTKNKIRLAETFYDSISTDTQEINFTSFGDGELKSINPEIKIIKNQNVVIDVSNSTLAFELGGVVYPAFDLKFYSDSKFNNEIFLSKIKKEGLIGITTTAKYNIPSELIDNNFYYRLIPINIEISPIEKREVVFDNSAKNTSKIVVVESGYNGSKSITKTSDNSFSYEIISQPEKTQYTASEADLKYLTNSRNNEGAINNVNIINRTDVNQIPRIESIDTENGVGARLTPISTQIGSINKTKKNVILYNLTSDFTIRPKVSIPQVARVTPLFELDLVEIKNRGFRYNFFPNLVLFDDLLNQSYDISFKYSESLDKIIIFKNLSKINKNFARLIPVNNDNGFEINGISYNSFSGQVTVTLKASFSSIDDFPFNVGEKVFIENIITLGGTNGYNSSDNNYQLFEIMSVDPNIGGSNPSFNYFIGENLNFGNIDDTFYSGTVVPDSYLVKFDLLFKKFEFIKGERIKTDKGKSGTVTKWDSLNNILNILSNERLEVNELILGESSTASTQIQSVNFPTAYSTVSSTSVIEKGWNRDTGFLNNNLQRIHDNDYYQYLSYELRSKVDFSKWSDTVDSLNHPSGFKKFGNLIIDSNQSNIGIVTNQDQGNVKNINDLVSEVSVNCFQDFDLVTENYFTIDDRLNSNEIYFQNRIIQDFIESTSNRVILIDDISENFAKSFTPTNSIIDSFKKADIRFRKYLIHIFDREDARDSQALLMNLIHDDINVSISQFAILESKSNLGNFDANISGPNLNIIFEPFITFNKIYSVNTFSFDINDSFEDTANLSLGDVCKIESSSVTSIGSTVITNISSDYRAGKILVVYSDGLENTYSGDEINFVQDGSKIIYNNYGEIIAGSYSGIGTFGFNSTISGFDLVFYPTKTNIEYSYNTNSILISDETKTQTDLLFLSGNSIQSIYKKVDATGTPVKTMIYTYDKGYTASLNLIAIKDLTNGNINYIEILVMLNSLTTEAYNVIFGDLNIGSKIGEFEIETSSFDRSMEIYFTPFNDIDYEIRIFSNILSKFRRSDTLEL
jgi:hypothetical protein